MTHSSIVLNIILIDKDGHAEKAYLKYQMSQEIGSPEDVKMKARFLHDKILIFFTDFSAPRFWDCIHDPNMGLISKLVDNSKTTEGNYTFNTSVKVPPTRLRRSLLRAALMTFFYVRVDHLLL